MASLSTFIQAVIRVFASSETRSSPSSRGSRGESSRTSGSGPAGAATVEVDPRGVGALSIRYAPERDGAPDAGEIVWTWVPYAENDGRGKDRPVLVIARQSAERVYAVKLTSKAHEGERSFLPIGSGSWDAQGRPSWVDVDQLYSVHERGLRREAAALDLTRFRVVAAELHRRFGWSVDV